MWYQRIRWKSALCPLLENLHRLEWNVVLRETKKTPEENSLRGGKQSFRCCKLNCLRNRRTLNQNDNAMEQTDHSNNYIKNNCFNRWSVWYQCIRWRSSLCAFLENLPPLEWKEVLGEIKTCHSRRKLSKAWKIKFSVL